MEELLPTTVLPLELVTKVLKYTAYTHSGRRPTVIVGMLCLGKAHRSQLEHALYDTVLLYSCTRLATLLRLVEQRASDGRPIRVRALSASGHDGTPESANRFLDLVRLLSPGLGLLQAGPGYTGPALHNADVPDLYLDDYQGGWVVPLRVPTRTLHALRSLWLGPFPMNMERLDQMLAMMPGLCKLGFIFVPCQPHAACQILDVCSARRLATVNFVVQEWSFMGTLMSQGRLRDALDAHVAAVGISTAYTIESADPNRWGIDSDDSDALSGAELEADPPQAPDRPPERSAEFCGECKAYVAEEDAPRCHSCSAGYHKSDKCSGFVFDGMPFVCRHCECMGCVKSTGFMLRCAGCRNSYHLDCTNIVPRPDAVRLHRRRPEVLNSGRWYCPGCQEDRCVGCGERYPYIPRVCAVCADRFCRACMERYAVTDAVPPGDGWACHRCDARGCLVCGMLGGVRDSPTVYCRCCGKGHHQGCKALAQGMTKAEFALRSKRQQEGESSRILYDWVCDVCSSCDVCMQPGDVLLLRCDMCLRRYACPRYREPTSSPPW
ncbi:hypothetical protein AURDEDRAFT_178454 [Auricularia subglabra TFB-10046 SS5]|uniref:PHD-type domain-containing protein n=1 Tax=Auricularia subglabra (strain TFB-10046 / SS5) TaxID=717982 RepID=J0L844_AURST|nr:hypothetical protein AURDEDRAFT_178454 [Auricularia subglabra TFB-10046 SS5]